MLRLFCVVALFLTACGDDGSTPEPVPVCLGGPCTEGERDASLECGPGGRWLGQCAPSEQPCVTDHDCPAGGLCGGEVCHVPTSQTLARACRRLAVCQDGDTAVAVTCTTDDDCPGQSTCGADFWCRKP